MKWNLSKYPNLLRDPSYTWRGVTCMQSYHDVWLTRAARILVQWPTPTISHVPDRIPTHGPLSLASQNLNIKIRFARLYLHIPQYRMEPAAWSFQTLANKKAQSATCFEHQTCNYLFIEQYICKTRFEVNFGVFPTNYIRMMSWNIKVC